MPYICIVFFMVLDLRLTEIGCRETINFFLSLFAHSCFEVAGHLGRFI